MSIQESIKKFNTKLFAHRREVAIRLRHKRQREEAEHAALELLIEDVLFQSGIQPTRANLPLITSMIQQVVRDARGQHQEEDDDGGSALKDFEL